MACSDRGVRQKRGQGVPAERDDDAGPDDIDLLTQPRTAGFDLAGARGPVVAGRRVRRRPMLHDVRDVDVFARKPRVRQQLLEEPPRTADKRAPAEILLTAGALADHHDRRVRIPLAGHGVPGAAPQRTAAAPCHAAPKRRKPLRPALPTHAHIIAGAA
jgi:hypothetical protein